MNLRFLMVCGAVLVMASCTCSEEETPTCAPQEEICGDGIDQNCDGTDTFCASAESSDHCRESRLDDGQSGVISATYDLACINATFGTCATGWMAVIYDHNGCGVTSAPGTLSVSVDLASVSGEYLLGLWCGHDDRRVWPAPRNVDPVCVTSYVTEGVTRTTDGAVCPGVSGSVLLPRFPASPTGRAVSCPAAPIPLVAPGHSCSESQRGMRITCIGSDGTTLCAWQTCDAETNLASACEVVDCSAPLP